MLGLACPSMGGSSRQCRTWTISSCPPPFGPASLTLPRLCSDLKVSAFWTSLHLLSYSFSQQVQCPGVPCLAPSPSVAPSSFLRVPALSTTEQRARIGGVLGRRGLALESAAARVCREAGGRVSVNVAVRALDIGVPDRADDAGWRSSQTGCRCSTGPRLQSTRLSFLSCAGMERLIHPRCVNEDGAALAQARRHKELRHPELAGQHGQAEECRQFLCQLASGNEPKVLHSRARQAWLHRWGSLLAYNSARVFAMSLLERRGGAGVDGLTPLHS